MRETTTEPIDAALLPRWLTIFIVKARNQRHLRRLWKHRPSLLLAFNIFIKVKPYENLAEAYALRFVSRHTSIPVPKVHCAFVYKGKTYIVMSKIRGQMLRNGWLSRPQESKKKILEQLSRMLAELRSVPRPAGVGVSNVNGGPFEDCRLPSQARRSPYATTRNFHQALANDLDPDVEYGNLGPDVAELLCFYRESRHDLVLTHGDLSSLNILARGDQVVGIVDWETAGWFPSYWEYTCAKYVNPYNTFWEQEVDHFLPSLPHELRMESIRRKYFSGDF
ncbi:hypothetical protein XA68_16444 [Ophiocordyceps unilateralis]|uniref:Aminoglycoside phosphotransferase domain-containing protein n=1 Tax=Ophiocordyceps unilateralis TaxID=268505 RepID=A0A2A9PLF3_OPHUN|nr:hypothetical protein XA68_16444 [Ophiocordyceps unilateralis]